jgi:predicted MPP superfamily phosphohydrolase
MSRLAPGTPLIRIAQISDLHCDETERLEPKLVEALKKEKPDLILFTGDSVNSREGWPIFYKTIKQVEEIAPLIAIKGD